MLCGSLDEKSLEREWIYVYLWLNHFTIHLKLSHCLLMAILQYKIKNLKKKERWPSLLFSKYKRDLKFSERKR